jgi:lipoprotein-anchoring transpeptidase ErfK/SrfK
MSRLVLALLIAAAAATPVLAQTAGPTPGQIVAKQQADQNRFQAQLQAEQLQQLQRRNDAALSSPSPGAQAEAMVQRQRIQQQIDQNLALQQKMAQPGANPADISSQLQQSGAEIQQLRKPQAPQP